MKPENPQPNAGPQAQPAARRNALATLRHRDFRLLWFGQLIATTGEQMQSVAISWHIFIMTDSSLHVGLVGLARVVPFLLLSFIGGAAADIVSRKRLILATQSVLMATTVALALATATGVITPGFIYAVSVISGAASAFDAPARQSILPNLVPRDELANAMALHTILRQTATIIGPGLGGLVIGLLGLAPTYGLTVLSFLAVLLALILMSVVPAPSRGASRGWDAVLGGFHYVRREPLVLTPLLLDFVVTLLRSYRVLLPVFARDVLALGPQALGLLHSAGSVGALGGAAVLGAIGDIRHKIAVMLLAYAAQGVFLVGFGFSSTLSISLLMLIGYGIGNVVSEVMRTTFVQLRTPDNLRGRVTALGAMFTHGGPQLGQVQMGAVASLLGPIAAAIIGGSAVVVACAGFALLPPMRRGMKEEKAAED